MTKVLAGLLICITFASKAQNITFVSSANRTFGDAPFIVLATSSSTLPIFYSASSTLVNININTVTMRGAGVLNITAYRSGGSSALQILTINKKAQSIIFGALPQKTFGDAPFIITGRSSTSLPVSYSVSNPIVQISRGRVINGVNIDTIKIIGVGSTGTLSIGTVTITAYSENDTSFGFTKQILTIHKKTQSIFFETLLTRIIGDTTRFILSAVSSASLPVLFSSASHLISINNDDTMKINVGTVSRVITVSTLKSNGVGMASITAYHTNNNYTNPPITQVLNIQPSLVYRDRDGDGLIEIYSINQLDSIRNNLTGICNVGTCNGYELTISLDFNNISSYRDTTKIFKTFTERSGSGWSPIGIAITASDTIQGIPYSAILRAMDSP